jgi:iron transport multicopper oxidase
MRNLLLALPLVGSASAALVEHWWNVSYAQANPDQLFERRVIGVNGSWPYVLTCLFSFGRKWSDNGSSRAGRPPPVTVNQNDTLLIHIYNGLDQPTSLHAHGIFFNQSSYYDGAVGVTQWFVPAHRTKFGTSSYLIKILLLLRKRYPTGADAHV